MIFHVEFHSDFRRDGSGEVCEVLIIQSKLNRIRVHRSSAQGKVYLTFLTISQQHTAHSHTVGDFSLGQLPATPQGKFQVVAV